MLSHRDFTAWAAGAGCAFGTPYFAFPGHRSPVPLNDASRSALGRTGLRQYEGTQEGGDNFFILQ